MLSSHSQLVNLAWGSQRSLTVGTQHGHPPSRSVEYKSWRVLEFFHHSLSNLPTLHIPTMAGSTGYNTTSTCLIALEEIRVTKKSLKEYHQTFQDAEKILTLLETALKSPPIKQHQLVSLLKSFTDLQQLYGRVGVSATRSAEFANQAQMALTSAMLQGLYPPLQGQVQPPPPQQQQAPMQVQVKIPSTTNSSNSKRQPKKPKMVHFKLPKKDPPPAQQHYEMLNSVEVKMSDDYGEPTNEDEFNFLHPDSNGVYYHLDHSFDPNTCV